MSHLAKNVCAKIVVALQEVFVTFAKDTCIVPIIVPIIHFRLVYTVVLYSFGKGLSVGVWTTVCAGITELCFLSRLFRFPWQTCRG